MQNWKRVRNPGLLLALVLLPACASGLATSIGGGIVGNLFDKGNQRMFAGNYNLVSIGGHVLPATIPASWIDSPPCNNITSARMTAGRIVVEPTGSTEHEWRGNAAITTTSEVTCRGESHPRVVNQQFDGRYKVDLDINQNFVEVFVQATGAQLSFERRDARTLVLDPQEYVFRKGASPDSSAQ